MKILSLHLLLVFCNLLFAQKAIIDTTAFKTWSNLGSAQINENGSYVCYNVREWCEGSKLVLQSTNSNWKQEFKRASSPIFGCNDRFLFKQGRDSLIIIQLKTGVTRYIDNVASFMAEKSTKWIAYNRIGAEKELVFFNVETGEERRIQRALNYRMNSKGNNAVIQTVSSKDAHSLHSLYWINLDENNIRKIWSGGYNQLLSGYSFDDDGNQLCFITEEKNDGLSSYIVYVYKKGVDSSKIIVSTTAVKQIDNNFEIANQQPKFTKDGHKILFSLTAKSQQPPKPSSLKLDVWSYKDLYLQPLQMEQLQRIQTSSAVVSIENGNIIQITNKNERVIGISDEWALVEKGVPYDGTYEAHWNVETQFSYSLVSLQHKTRKTIKDNVINLSGTPALSKTGKWIVFYDFDKEGYFTYEVMTGSLRKVSGIKRSWEDVENSYPEPKLPAGIKWIGQDEALIVSDSYDIWQLDPTGIKPPINLTNGYGKKNKIKFQVLNEEDELSWTKIDSKPSVLLKAVNTSTKDWGFYVTNLNVQNNPMKLSMGPYIYGSWGGHDSPSSSPIKAKNSNVYLIQRSSATDARNFFVTTDFKNFIRLTNVQPQNTYNWYTTELHKWKAKDGMIHEGILYKPENFDPQKKYPIIFDYYDKRTDELNFYHHPKPSEDRINIPSFVSNGYLIFVPDMYFDNPNVGECAYKSLMSAVEYLSKYDYIDRSKMGVQGHSFGGYLTNYIVTRTNIFSAACSASGFADLISWYTSAARGTYPMYWAENQQGRIGGTPWTKQKIYLDNSPILKVHKVNTPLLLMHNQGDKVVLFSQGVQFFTSLRRLGKRVWMLQYEKGGHALDREEAEDYHIRMMQFFDHYLKDKPAPYWMTRGIPAALKGIDDGLGLDQQVKTPLPRLLISAENSSK